jgi:uncharacterized membrane protein YphA (DoxX/SURF4 family)
MLQPFLIELKKSIPSASLAFFRIIFGLLMLISIARFLLKDWVKELYIQPKFYFAFFDASWLRPLPGQWMYIVFFLLLIAAFFILIGYCFRISSAIFFVLFTYIELLDKTNYLNHYYLISLFSFLMIFLPLNSNFSLDARFNPTIFKSTVPRWNLLILRLQIGIVYFFAGFAKLKYDWLMEAQPLKIWLSANSPLPLIGVFLEQEWMAYAFSWGGMLFDLSVPFLLIHRKTRMAAFILIVIFHSLTMVLFNIGMFPLMMVSLALVFFSPTQHQRILSKLSIPMPPQTIAASGHAGSHSKEYAAAVFFSLYFLLQLFLPLRHLLYPGNVLWTERGFRFSWNVMLMEKNAFIEFYMFDQETKKEWLVPLQPLLTKQQQRMMACQPDMIIQFARFLAKDHQSKTGHKAQVRVECYASLNGRASRLLIDPETDLSSVGADNKQWILN